MICFKAVKAMFGEAGGLADGLSAGKIWVDHSTTDFGQTFEFDKAVRSFVVIWSWKRFVKCSAAWWLFV